MHLGRENQLLRALVGQLEIECDGVQLEKLFSHVERVGVTKENEWRLRMKKLGIKGNGGVEVAFAKNLDRFIRLNSRFDPKTEKGSQTLRDEGPDYLD